MRRPAALPTFATGIKGEHDPITIIQPESIPRTALGDGGESSGVVHPEPTSAAPLPKDPEPTPTASQDPPPVSPPNGVAEHPFALPHDVLPSIVLEETPEPPATVSPALFPRAQPDSPPVPSEALTTDSPTEDPETVNIIRPEPTLVAKSEGEPEPTPSALCPHPEPNNAAQTQVDPWQVFFKDPPLFPIPGLASTTHQRTTMERFSVSLKS